MWVHRGRFSTYDAARADRNDRLDELRRRWDEEHAKIKALVVMYRQKAAYNDGMASRLQAAETRLRKFEEAGPPEAVPLRQKVSMRLTGGRTAKRAVIATGLELRVDGGQLMKPFDPEVWFGERVGVLGQQRLGQVALPAAAGGRRQRPRPRAPAGRATSGRPRSSTPGASCWARGCGRGGSPRPTTTPSLHGRTLLEILHRGDDHRAGMPREVAARALDRYGLARASEQTFESLSGGQQARLQILLLELSGATLLLLDEPTDNLDLHSAEALEDALEAFEGTVLAVTHDRWFARGLDRFLVFRADGRVVASDEPVWDEGRVDRAR